MTPTRRVPPLGDRTRFSSSWIFQSFTRRVANIPAKRRFFIRDLPSFVPRELAMTLFKKNAYLSLAVGIALLALILFLLIVGYAQIKTAQNKAKSANAPIHVLVDSETIASYVENVGADAVQVVSLPAGVAFADLDAKIRARIAASQVAFLTKTYDEECLIPDVKSLAPDAIVVNLRDELDFGTAETDPEDESKRWISPEYLDTILPLIAGTLAQFKPERASYFKENAKKLESTDRSQN